MQHLLEIQRLHRRVSSTSQALVWMTLGLVYATIVLASLILGAIAGWGLWVALLATIALPFAIVFLHRQLAVWEIRYLSQAPQSTNEHPVVITESAEEVPGFHVDIPVYTPPAEQESLLSYESGYAPH